MAHFLDINLQQTTYNGGGEHTASTYIKLKIQFCRKKISEKEYIKLIIFS